MPTLQLTLISAAIAGALGFGFAWQIQSLRADSLEKTHVEQKLAQEQDARKLDQARTSALAAAQNAGIARQAVLRADADAARAVNSRLRSERAVAIATVASIAHACADPRTASGELLGILKDAADETADALIELAGKADRHVSDIKTLTDAWSK